jgi:hypothetical protein
MHKWSAVLALLAACAVHANAQSIPSGNVYVGYSYLSAPPSPSLTSRNNLNGWNSSVEFKVAPWVGVVADFGGNYGTFTADTPCVPGVGGCGPVGFDTKLHTFLFGPRLSASVGRFRPFAHFLVGGAHSSGTGAGLTRSDTSSAVALGGGLDYKVVKGIAWRAQFDDLVTNALSSSQNNLRFSTGIVFRF